MIVYEGSGFGRTIQWIVLTAPDAAYGRHCQCTHHRKSNSKKCTSILTVSEFDVQITNSCSELEYYVPPAGTSKATMTTSEQSERPDAVSTLSTVQVARLAVLVLVGEANVFESTPARTVKKMKDCMLIQKPNLGIKEGGGRYGMECSNVDVLCFYLSWSVASIPGRRPVGEGTFRVVITRGHQTAIDSSEINSSFSEDR